MKKIKEFVNRHLNTFHHWWQALPQPRQNRYVLCFFAGYLLLTTAVVLSPFFNDGKALKHIQKVLPENPATVTDSLVKTLKRKFYERK